MFRFAFSFLLSLIAAPEGNLLIPYSVPFSLPSALSKYSIPFSFSCTLFCVVHPYRFVFQFTNSLLPFVFLCFSFCRHPISSRPPCKKLMESHFFLITVIVLSKKKKPKSLKDCDHCKQIGTMGSSTHCSECVR